MKDHLKGSPLLPVPYEKGFAVAGSAGQSGEQDRLMFPNVENTMNQLKD